MKQKSYKQIKMNELFYNKKHNIELNNKSKIPKIKNPKYNQNNINLIYNTTTETPYIKTNSIKNLTLKTKLIKLLSIKNKTNRNEKINNKYYKKLSFYKTKTANTEISIDNQINNISEKKIIPNKKESQNFTHSYKCLDKDNINNHSITPIKSLKNEEKIGNKTRRILDKANLNNIANKTVNELDYKNLENNYMNLKNKKGTFSFNNFYRNNENEKGQENVLESERKYFDNRFKDKLKNKTIKKENLKIGKTEDIINSTVKDIKNRNNIILLNFRSDKRKRFIREDRISTSSEREISAKNGALKILEILRNKKSEKIILKKNVEAKTQRSSNSKSNEISKKMEENNIEINDNNQINENNIEKNNLEIKRENNDNINENKDNQNNTNIFNKIIEEVKQEKNIVQKIVHRKLIQGVNELKKYKSCNKLNGFNRRYNTETFNDISIKNLQNQNSVLFDFLSEKNKDKNDENEDIFNVNIRSNLISDRKEKNNRYLNINLDEFKNVNRNYEKYKTYDNSKINDYSYDKNENNGVRIKKIKLDKLKNKLQKNKLNYYNGDKININLNLNNRIINIHNSQRIYMPKRISITKRPSLEMMSIPIYYSHSPDYNIKNNYLMPYIYSKNENFNHSTYINNNNIKPFNDINIFDLNNCNKNKYNLNQYQNMNRMSKTINGIIINNKINNNESNSNIINNSIKNIKNININYNNMSYKENVKHILYSKAKIKRSSKNSFSKTKSKNLNLSTSRYKTIRYIKKSKNKIERINSNSNSNNNMNIINKTRNNSINKIIKIQDMQIGGVSKKNSEKTISNIANLDKTQPINFNLKSPSKKQNSFITYKTYFSSEINEIPKKNEDNNYSQLYCNNWEEKDDTLSSKKFNTGMTKLGYNFSYDKIVNNITGTDDIINENNEVKFEQILNLLSFEDLLIIEDKFNLILIVLEKGNKTYEEHFDLWNYFFSSGLKSKLEQIFKYFIKQTENLKTFINYSLVFIMICYDFVVNSICIDIDNNFSLIEIGQVIYTNLLFIINLIKSRILFDNKDNYNIRLIELSKIEMTIKNKLSNIDNDYLFIREILHSNTNLIIKKITSVIESNILNNISTKKYTSDLFSKINTCSLEELNKFFLDNILKEDFIGCSVLAYTYLKEKQTFIPAIVPYIRVPNKKKYTLVLDLDETLIHFKVNNNENEEGVLKLRPGVFTFLEKVREYYEIILFTEASEAYTKLMMEAFSNNKNNKMYFDYKFYRQHTIIIGQDFIKDLSRIGRPLDKTIIIDNIAQNFKMQKSNGILIKPFLGEDHNDQALIDLIPILVNIARDEIDSRNGLMKYRDEILTKISSNLFRRNKHK